jgi:hypothetical protein
MIFDGSHRGVITARELEDSQQKEQNFRICLLHRYILVLPDSLLTSLAANKCYIKAAGTAECVIM